jgi:cbb3-type cytochrome oxidase subunit 3
MAVVLEQIWLIWLLVLFIGIIVWVMWPGRRRQMRRHAEIPLRDDEPPRDPPPRGDAAPPRDHNKV